MKKLRRLVESYVILIFVMSLHADFVRKVNNVRIFLKNRVLVHIADKKHQNTFNNEYYKTFILDLQSFGFWISEIKNDLLQNGYQNKNLENTKNIVLDIDYAHAGFQKDISIEIWTVGSFKAKLALELVR